ncbi:MAG: NAD-dependent epimerase [Bacteroidota bacterium]
MKKFLVTGTAGFIGYHMSLKLLKEGYAVWGIDNMNDYYDTSLKWDRVQQLNRYPAFHFSKMDVSNTGSILHLFKEQRFTHVYHLAAQAGVRYSLEHPQAYIQSNLQGFANVLEGCRQYPVRHLIYASSSSVYGLNIKQPFKTSDTTDHPVSLYAATKKSNEMMAHSYSYLYEIPATGLRFFTVYGPYGRPDMAYFKFVKQILENKPIQVYNNGDMARDFTYIDDIIESMYRLMDHYPTAPEHWDPLFPDPSASTAPYRVYNIGNNEPVQLMDFLDVIQTELGKKAEIEFQPMQPGDVYITWADSSDLYKEINFSPSTPLEDGISEFVSWYRTYYQQRYASRETTS